MTKTEFLIGATGLEFGDDLYPEDLPEEWYFDYYSSLFKALALPINNNEDLDLIFEIVHDELDNYFELVLILDEQALNDDSQLKQLLSGLQQYRDNFTLWCNITSQPKASCLKLIANNKVCLQSEIEFKIKLNHCKVFIQNLYYSDTPILLLPDLGDVESIAQELLTKMQDLPRVAIICTSILGDNLNQMQSISELVNK